MQAIADPQPAMLPLVVHDRCCLVIQVHGSQAVMEGRPLKCRAWLLVQHAPREERVHAACWLLLHFIEQALVVRASTKLTNVNDITNALRTR